MLTKLIIFLIFNFCKYLQINGCECGLDGATNRLFNANGLAPHRFPWLTHIRIYDEDNSLLGQCGGTLIDHKHVISAAHCFVFNKTMINKNQIKVFLGVHSIVDKHLPKPEKVSKIGVHKKYFLEGIPDAGYDIAIIELAHSVRFSNTIYPICLPNSVDLPTKLSDSMKVAGWGASGPEGGITLGEPKKIEVMPISNQECWNRKLHHFLVELEWGLLNIFGMPKIEPTMICTFGKNNSSPCSGDSGGPLMYKNPNNGLWYLFGIVSFSWKDCGSNAPAIYTRVASYNEMITNLAPDSCVLDL